MVDYQPVFIVFVISYFCLCLIYPNPPQHFPCFQGSLIQEVQDLLGPNEDPNPSHWKDKKASTLERWTVLRPFMVNQTLFSEKPKGVTCHHCRSKVAVVMCHDCLPRPLHCTACDLAIHDSMVLHNRPVMVEGFYRPLPPTTHIREEERGKFSYHERGIFCTQDHIGLQKLVQYLNSKRDCWVKFLYLGFFFTGGKTPSPL